MSIRYGKLRADEVACLADCRQRACWEACLRGETLWVRCPPGGSESDERAWAGLPFDGRYEDDGRGNLRPVGRKIAMLPIPDGSWLRLAEFLRPASTPIIPPPPRPMALPFRLNRGRSGPKKADVWLCQPEIWLAWVEMAPASRLAGLEFARSSAGRAIVRGQRLPPIPGQALCVYGSVALPAGWVLPEFVHPSWLVCKLDLPRGAVLLLDPDGQAEIIPAQGFMPARRANVRATEQQFNLPEEGAFDGCFR